MGEVWTWEVVGWIGWDSRVSFTGERRSDFRGMDALKGG